MLITSLPSLRRSMDSSQTQVHHLPTQYCHSMSIQMSAQMPLVYLREASILHVPPEQHLRQECF
jgi:hypothetical protein